MRTKEIFAERLHIARRRKRLKQRELAERIGLSYQSISAYENVDKCGNTKSPSLEHAVAIAKELEVSLDWLCGIE